MALIDYYNYNKYVDECHKYNLDDDYIEPPEKYCDIDAFYSLIWQSWYGDKKERSIYDMN